MENACEHVKGDDAKIIFSPEDGGIYVAYTCPKCGDSIKDYHELCNRYNESKEMEESCPDQIINTERENLNKPTKEGFFEITSVHRDDIRYVLNLTDEHLIKITDDMMEEIAEKMAEDYGEQLFSNSLRIIAKEVLEQNRINQGD